MKPLIAALVLSIAPASAQLPATFCSYGNDSEGYESPAFRIGPDGYSDGAMTCKTLAHEDIGGGWLRISQSCPNGTETINVRVSGNKALAVLEDGHEYTLKPCD